jgi:hypothetical protein
VDFLPPSALCEQVFDFDGDGDVDTRDYAMDNPPLPREMIKTREKTQSALLVKANLSRKNAKSRGLQPARSTKSQRAKNQQAPTITDSCKKQHSK